MAARALTLALLALLPAASAGASSELEGLWAFAKSSVGLYRNELTGPQAKVVLRTPPMQLRESVRYDGEAGELKVSATDLLSGSPTEVERTCVRDLQATTHRVGAKPLKSLDESCEILEIQDEKSVFRLWSRDATGRRQVHLRIKMSPEEFRRLMRVGIQLGVEFEPASETPGPVVELAREIRGPGYVQAWQTRIGVWRVHGRMDSVSVYLTGDATPLVSFTP
jgi:hypothetical protein